MSPEPSTSKDNAPAARPRESTRPDVTISSNTSSPPSTPNDARPPAALVSSEAPPNGQAFSDIEELKDYLQDWAGDHGFAISCTSSRGGDYYTMRCKKSRGTGGCPWTMVVRRFFFAVDNKPDGRLAWTTTNFEHNHPPMPRGTFAIHRRPTSDVREFVEKSGEAGEKPRTIVAAVRKMDGCADFDIDAVYYILAQWRRRSRAAAAVEAPAGPSSSRPRATEVVINGGGVADAHGEDGVDAMMDEGEDYGALPDGDDTTGGPPPGSTPPVDARGRTKPFCSNCQQYVRHHGGICREPARKRKKPGVTEREPGAYKDAGTQTEPIDIMKDPQFALQIANILQQASQIVRDGARRR